MEISALTKDGYHRLLRRLQGTGYTAEPGSVRDTEVEAVAQVASMAAEGLARVARNFFVSSADDTLDVYERVRFLVESSGLDVARRQKRLLAFVRGATKLVRARLAYACSEYLGTTDGVTLEGDVSSALFHRASPASLLVVGRREPSADNHAARDLSPILERGLPARAIAGGVSSADLTYGAQLDARLSVALVGSMIVPAQTKARSAPIEVYPGVVFPREAWIELQSQLMYKSHGFPIDQAAQGRSVLFTGELAASATVVVDGPSGSSISWERRLITVAGVARADDDEDLSTATIGEHVWLAPSKTGDVGGGPVHELVRLDGTSSGLTLTVDGDGDLVLENTGGATAFVALLVRAYPKLGEASEEGPPPGDTQPWASTTSVEHDPLAELYAASVVSDDAPGAFRGGAAGALRRIVYTGGLTREPVTGAIRTVILDSSEDYRNRFLLVVPLTFPVGAGSDPAYYPAASAEGLVPRGALAETPRLFYTGAGADGSREEILAFQHPDRVDAPDVWLFVDEDGNLCAEMKDESAHKSACFMALIFGTERDEGSSVVTSVPVHATSVQTLDLEQPQNVGVFAQGFQGGVPRLLPSSSTPRAIPTCPPLGLISEGPPPLRPLSWRVRERLGLVDDATYEVRQKIIGQRKRLFSLELPAGSLTPIDDFNIGTELASGVNDQLDFRDRLVWLEGRVSESDIRALTSLDDSEAEPIFAALYTGPWKDVELEIAPNLTVYFEFSKSAGGYHSRLCLRNTGETDLYVNGAIEASGFLGLTDLRQYGVINAWTCSSTDELEYDENLGCSNDSGSTGGSLSKVW